MGQSRDLVFMLRTVPCTSGYSLIQKEDIWNFKDGFESKIHGNAGHVGIDNSRRNCINAVVDSQYVLLLL